MNNIQKKDAELVFNSNMFDWNSLKDKTIFITGGTGLIGSCFINAILYADNKLDLNCNIIALVRNVEKAKKIFELYPCDDLTFIEGDIREKIVVREKIDYIIHAASQTNSKDFINNSIDTIDISLKGTENVLNLAREKEITKIIFLSTMEVYGRPNTDEKITEKHSTNLVTNEVRNCYPISKMMCENLCICYARKYNFECNIARLTQTFGAGVRYDDSRVFAEFARCVIENRDIILHTKGETKRNYLYTADAINALITILLNGQNCEIYNIANENTYCSIYEMAQIVAQNNKNINVRIELEDINKYGFAPMLCMNLDTTKLQSLGWRATVDLDEMYKRTIDYMKSIKQ